MQVTEYKAEYRLSQWSEIITGAEAERKECARVVPGAWNDN